MAEPSRLSLGDVVPAATFAVALATGWLYVAGWSYAYHYLDRVRIPLLMVQFPSEHYLAYGGLVVWKNVWAAVAVAAALAGLAWACARWSGRLGRLGVCSMLVLAVAALFALARGAGVTTARADFLQQRGADYPAYPRVALALKKDAAAAVGNRLADLPTSDCGRLVLFSGDRLFLIRPVFGASAAALDSFVVPLSQVEAFRIMGEYHSCP